MYKEISLAIETIIRRGSFSIFSDDIEIDFQIGKAEISRSEDLLDEISKMLARHKIERKEVKKIFLSDGQGSLTGQRVGKSMALGLKNGLNATLEVFNFKEIFSYLADAGDSIKVIFETGKNHVYILSFQHQVNEDENVCITEDIITIKVFEDQIAHNLLIDVDRLFISPELAKKQIDSHNRKIRFELLRSNLSYYIGKYGTERV